MIESLSLKGSNSSKKLPTFTEILSMGNYADVLQTYLKTLLKLHTERM